MSHVRGVLKQNVQAVLTHRFLAVYLAIFGCVLMLPSLNAGLLVDDYYHEAALTAKPYVATNDASLFGLFSFMNGDPDRITFLIRTCGVPWWTYEALKVSFFRPLTEITHWLDYTLWPDNPKFMHFQNLVWFAAVIFMALLVYRRFIGPVWVAGFAGLLFAVDVSHAMPVLWLANRNALLATFFGLLTLYFHDRWRRDDLNGGGAIAAVMFVLALLSAEFALSVTAYLFAYMICIESGNWRKRILTIVPYFLIGTIWLVMRQGLGFGTQGSGWYIDPGNETLLYLAAIVKRAPILLEGRWGIIPAELFSYFSESGFRTAWGAVIIFLGLIGVILTPVLKNNSAARFFGIGMLISLLPICATYPDNRLLFFVGLGATGLMAQLVGAWFKKVTWLPATPIYRFAAGMLVFYIILFKLFFSAAFLPITTSRTVKLVKYHLDTPALNLPLDVSSAVEVPHDPEAEKHLQNIGTHVEIIPKDLVLINPPMPFFTYAFQVFRNSNGLPMAFPFHVLTSGIVDLIVKRSDERTLEITARDGHFANHFDQLYRGNGYPMHIGQKVETTGMDVEVLSLASSGRPETVAFRFSRSLDDPGMILLRWDNGKYVPFTLPAVGMTEHLKAVDVSM